MSAEAVRTTPADFADARWEDILPRYKDLAQRPLDDVDAWLCDWSALESVLGEAATLASIAYSTDTSDPEREAAHLRWSSEIGPRAAEQGVRLARRLLERGHSRADLETVVRRFANSNDLFREENVAIHAELSRLSARYQKITGAMTVQWDGQELTLPQVRAKLIETERPVRERAFRLANRPYIEGRDELAALFDEMLQQRQKLARNAGLADYRDYAHREKHRFDYTAEDCLRWHDAVAGTAVPAAQRILERRRQDLGVASLRPWDLAADPLGRPPLRPFADVGVLSDRAARIFDQVDPVLGGYYQTLMEEELLDLDSRKAKAPGGYCTSLPYRRRPFIFMNAVGVEGDVKTLMHEAGHAFHGFEAMASQPLVWQRRYGSEMAEVASMSMELLSSPYQDEAHGGYYSEDEARRARIDHLEGIILFFGHCASVDAFQHWIYTEPEGADADARDARWLELRRRFEPGVDWTGLEAERIARWYSQLHFFQYPFYYIEYGIAQLGALQVWRNSLRDQAGAVADYRRALALGGSRPLPELFGTAGARLVFDTEGLADLVAFCEEQLLRLAG